MRPRSHARQTGEMRMEETVRKGSRMAVRRGAGWWQVRPRRVTPFHGDQLAEERWVSRPMRWPRRFVRNAVPHGLASQRLLRAKRMMGVATRAQSHFAQRRRPRR
jgi:hypothetical protein